MNISTRLKTHMLLIDGAMGTALQALDLSNDDFGGEALAGCNENLVLTRPNVIQSIHEKYLEAGADIVETNTFGATPLVLDEYQLGHKADEINREAVRLAKAACEKYSTPDKPRFVAGAMGPTTKSLSVTGGITFDELAENFYQQAISLIDAGADYLLLETALDTLNLKAGVIGIYRAFEKLGKKIPIAISGTIETMGTMLAGQGVEALYISLEHINPLYIGLNCATGPALMTDHIRTLAAISRFPVSVAPNAGIPDADGNYPETPEEFSKAIKAFVDQKWVNVIGGCCGTTYEHIRALSKMLNPESRRIPTTESASRVSGIDPLILEDDGRPYIVGERTNVIGSRKFKELITEEKFEEAAEIARKQVKSGAHIVDVCLSNPDRDEVQDMTTFLSQVVKQIKAPLMIDSQVPAVVEAAFKLTQGKCILNSVNLEDGEKSFEELIPIVKKYGASVVVGCIQGEMAVTAADKLKVAKESVRLLTTKYGMREEDLVFDPLVFPCGTGDENYFGSGQETIDGVRLIKETFPKCRTVLGISNVSFGLPPAGREVLNSVFLYHCTKAGLDMAIVNSEKLVRFAQITDEEKRLCDDLLRYKTDDGSDPITNFVAYFRDKAVQEKPKVDRSKLSIEEKLRINIVEGTKEYLIENLDEALEKYKAPLLVINQPLMAAMDIVGRMFNNNELIVAEVLQSAEAMKAAVSYLEKFMDKNDIEVRGTMVLATVKGDVHDIGKNLVQIILGNNGYRIIDLGIKCASETLMAAVNEHKPDLVGLSGLLVKSAQQMVLTAQDFKSAGISVPILVGGAALTDRFTAAKIAPEYAGPVVYCKDAMSGLDVANKLMDAATKPAFLATLQAAQDTLRVQVDKSAEAPKRTYAEKVVIDHSTHKPTPPHFNDIIVTTDKLEDIWKYVNPQMMYGNHLGFKGNVKKAIEQGDEKIMKLVTKLDDLKYRIVSEKLLHPKALYRFYPVKADGNAIVVDEKMRFEFPRQTEGMGLCLSDFVDSKQVDSICFFVVTCGEGVAQVAKDLMEQGNYFDSHALSALALESAEAYAEYLHKRIRTEWGIPDLPDLSLEDTFKLKYRGARFSFGYPACPNLDDQVKMWDLMDPEAKIGVALSEECMMSPEASVSAMVFHHPQARYFSV